LRAQPERQLVHGGACGLGRRHDGRWAGRSAGAMWRGYGHWSRKLSELNVLGPVPEVDVMAKRPQGLLNVGTLSARMAVLRSCALDI
jgi:hypothetical protein